MTLTGSEAGGNRSGIGAAKSIKKSVLELGGSDAYMVMASANLEEAAATAAKSGLNNGQTCIAAKRFIVAEGIADQFQQKFVSKMEALKLGDPFDASTELGPLATKEGVADLDADVRKTVAAGARVLTGGKALEGPGNFYAPTVLADIPKNSPGYGEELFGPVASLFRVKDIDAAIKLANDTRFGLGASAWTNDPANANASLTSSMPGWSSSIRWWRRTRGCRLEALRRRDTGGSWGRMDSRIYQRQDGLG